MDPTPDFPGWQDDNLGRNPPEDFRTAEADHEVTGNPLEPEQHALHEALENGPPPLDNLYKGGRIDESVLDGWKEKLRHGEPVVVAQKAAAVTHNPLVALAYHETSPGPDGASQRLGRPVTEADGIRDVAGLVPGHEVLERRTDFSADLARRLDAARSEGDTDRVEQLERLGEAVNTLAPAVARRRRTIGRTHRDRRRGPGPRERRADPHGHDDAQCRRSAGEPRHHGQGRDRRGTGEDGGERGRGRRAGTPSAAARPASLLLLVSP